MTDQATARSRRLLLVGLALGSLTALLLAPFAFGFVRYGSPLELFRRRSFESQA